MPNLKEVRNSILSVKSTQQITKAMKMVAAAKLRKAQDSILQLRPYAKKLQGILENVTTHASSDLLSVYAEQRPVNKVLIVVLTSDRGLCGAFNSNAIKTALKHIEENFNGQMKSGNVWIMPVGKKAYDFFRKGGYQIIDQYKDIFGEIVFDEVKDAAEFAMDGFREKRFDRIDIVFNEFKNVATQMLVAEQFLPVKKEDETELHGMQQGSVDYIIEPSVEFILNELIPQTLKMQFFKAILESNASEHGARMTAMDQATDNAGEILKQYRLVYNRTRQAAITKEILEIVGGANALENE